MSSARAGRASPGAGSSTSTGVSSTSRTFFQPATACWVMSMISVNSATGSRKMVTRKAKATRVPTVRPPSGPMAIPTSSTAAVVRTPNSSPEGKKKAPMVPARTSARRRPSTERITRRCAWAWTP